MPAETILNTRNISAEPVAGGLMNNALQLANDFRNIV